MNEFSDIVIVGSGFGGSVSAVNLAEAAARDNLNLKITMLEKGHDFYDLDPKTLWKYRNDQGNGFRQTLDVAYTSRLMDVSVSPPDLTNMRKFPQFVIGNGRGVGGGSLVYYAVSLRAPNSIFGQKDDKGRALWPSHLSRQALDPYYKRLETNLKVARLAWSDRDGAEPWQLCSRRDYIFAQGCLAAGVTAEPLKVATHKDANDGWWTSGHRHGGRQHLPLNYLRQAKNAGVEIESDCQVKSIAPNGDGYVLTVQDNRSNTTRTIECRILILSGGVTGSMKALLDSEENFKGTRSFSETLGTNISGNGDYLLSGTIGKQYRTDNYKGKPMSSFCPSYWNDHKFLLIPMDSPPFPFAFGQPADFDYPKNPEATGRASTEARNPYFWGREYMKVAGSFGSNLLSVGILCLDNREGRVNRDMTKMGRLFVEWPETHPETEKRWATATKYVRNIFNALDGEIFADMYRTRGTVGTVHPLGGCSMGANKDTGVVSPWGEVFGNKNLFVIDGSIIPSALGVNPSLTIGAVADMLSSRLGTELSNRMQ
ncbi:MAG: GMC family oxidoreductase [Oligoflexales bacterium]